MSSKLIMMNNSRLIGSLIVDKSSYVSPGAVAWSEIKNISFYQMKKEKLIAIELYDPERLVSRQPVWRQKLMHMNIGMTSASIHLTSLNLSCSLYELFPLLYRRWNMHRPGTDQDIQEETIEK